MPANTPETVGTVEKQRPPDDAASLIADGDYGAYQIALERRQVTFHHVAGAWFHLCDEALSHQQRERFRELFPLLMDTFAEPRGGVVTSYFCRNIRVAAALTDIRKAAELPETVPTAGPGEPAIEGANGHNGHSSRTPWRRDANGGQSTGRFQRLKPPVPHPIRPMSASSSAIHLEPTFGDPADWQAKRILFSCLDLHYRALEFLTPKPRKICMRLAFGVITSLLGAIDSRRGPGSDPAAAAVDPAEIEGLERELARAERYYARSSQRTAQLEYFIGMLLLGLPLLVVAVAAAALATGSDILETPLLVSLLAGGVGAIVSVMNRMTSGSLVLVAESGKAIIRLLGAIRPLLGAVLGIALYVLLSAGLVSVASTPNNGKEVLVAAGLGFLAGFSERFAQDMIAGAAGGQTSTPATAAVQAEPPGGPQLHAGPGA
jgi:hypothetical protein